MTPDSARQAVHRALRDGALLRQPCEKCGSETALAHHEDYDRPLDVRWLCSKHHMQHHHERRLSPTRANVLRQMVAGTRASAIAEQLGISRKRVYEHLKELRNAGFLPK